MIEAPTKLKPPRFKELREEIREMLANRKRHDKREIVNLIRWCLMAFPPPPTTEGHE